MRWYVLLTLAACGASDPAKTTSPAATPSPTTTPSVAAEPAPVVSAPPSVSAPAAEPTSGSMNGPFSFAAFSPDGKTLALGGKDLVLVDVPTRKRVLAKDGMQIRALAWAPNGVLAVGTGDLRGTGEIMLWRLGENEPTERVPRNRLLEWNGNHIAWSADGSRLFADGSVRDDKLQVVRRVEYRRQEGGLRESSWALADGHFSGDALYGWKTVDERATYCVWPESGPPKAAGIEMKTNALTLGMRADDPTSDLVITSTGIDAFIVLEKGKVRRKVAARDVFFAGGRRLGTLDVRGAVEISTVDDEKPIARYDHKFAVHACAVSHDGKTLACNVSKSITFESID